MDKVEGKGLSTNDLTDALVALIGGAFQKEDIAQDLGDSETKVVSQAAITAVLLQYAKVDGYYSQLTAGAAENLVGRGSVPASFLRRTTGGTADVGTGSAKIAKLMGNSIVWNQLVYNGNFANDVNGWSASRGTINWESGKCKYTVTELASSSAVNRIEQTIKIVSGHKYFLYCEIELPKATNVRIENNAAGLSIEAVGSVGKNILSGIDEASGNGNFLYFGINNSQGTGYDVGDVIYFDNIMVIDLTSMFGAGKEPTTVAEFKALFPLPYYAYEPGKVLPFAAEKLVTTGFNQWDEEWELGLYDDTTGAKVPGTTTIRNTNPIKVFGSTEYYFNNPGRMDILFYTIDGQFISRTQLYGSGTKTTPANCGLMNFRLNTEYGTTYHDDVCINLSWSGYRNGEYEPFELHESIFDPANWEDANGNKIFPYGGMHGVGTAGDFATPDTDGFIRKATRVMERVDLGSLEWNLADGVFSVILSDMVAISRNPNGVCAKYPTVTVAYTYMPDKSLLLGDAAYSVALNRVIIKDSAYSDAAAFKAAMSGVYLYYELAEPVETELAEPVGASYYANDFGTEEWQPANTDVPYTAPCNMNVAYAMNAVDTLRRLPENYISVGSFENFCTELSTKLGAALNKTITIAATYNSETGEYDYDITIADVGE